MTQRTIKEIMFYEPGEEMNKAIVNLAGKTTQEIAKLMKIQIEHFGRSEYKLLKTPVGS